jgi:HEAT repeat protein
MTSTTLHFSRRAMIATLIVANAALAQTFHAQRAPEPLAAPSAMPLPAISALRFSLPLTAPVALESSLMFLMPIARFDRDASFNGMNLLEFRAQDPADPADSLYRAGRAALNSAANRRAADLFREVRTKYPRSRSAEDAPYWEAFALLRIGTDADLRQAREALDWQQSHFPDAATRGDAGALATRIEGRLARTGDTQAVRYIEGRGAERSCPKEDEDERIDALNALISMDAERAMPMLKTVLARRDACSAGLRRKAVWLVATRKAPDATEILLQAVNTDPDSEVREQAVFWLGNVPSEAATDVLIRLARTSPDEELRGKAIFSLSRVRSARASTALREIALDASAPADVRAEAVQWYLSSQSHSGGTEALAFVTAMYAKATDETLKDRLLFATAQLHTTDAVEFLLRVARDPREESEARRQAVFHASRAGASTAQLIQLYDQNTDTEVGQQLLWVLSTAKDAAGIEKVLDVARNGRNAELRKQAVFWLSRSKDPRALKYLLEIIER